LALTVVRVAAVRLGPEIAALEVNRRASVSAIEEAAAAGAELVVLPELAVSGYVFSGADEAQACAEPVPGPSTEAWQEAAKRSACTVVGGLCELDRGGCLRNSAVVVDSSGVLAVYRKLHLWGRETLMFVPGDDPPPVVETQAGRIGVGICYDLWFPELARSLALRGADILAAPSNLSASPPQPGLPHLDVVVAIATAHVNRMHVVIADRCRVERGEEWLGALLVVAADGTVMAQSLDGARPGSALAELDIASARDKRWGQHNDLAGDRRPPGFYPG
jgi:predicted amidohydrolase